MDRPSGGFAVRRRRRQPPAATGCLRRLRSGGHRPPGRGRAVLHVRGHRGVGGRGRAPRRLRGVGPRSPQSARRPGSGGQPPRPRIHLLCRRLPDAATTRSDDGGDPPSGGPPARLGQRLADGVRGRGLAPPPGVGGGRLALDGALAQHADAGDGASLPGPVPVRGDDDLGGAGNHEAVPAPGRPRRRRARARRPLQGAPGGRRARRGFRRAGDVQTPVPEARRRRLRRSRAAARGRRLSCGRCGWASNCCWLFATFSEADFGWRREPYEFVAETPAIDLLAGTDRFRTGLDGERRVERWYASWEEDQREFRAECDSVLLYS